MLSFTLLGPVRLLADGVPLTGLAPRHRAVLGYLLLNAGRVISMERLIDAMWGYDQPDTARSQIHASITAIRRTLRAAGADGLLETRAGGYVVSPPLTGSTSGASPTSWPPASCAGRSTCGPVRRSPT